MIVHPCCESITGRHQSVCALCTPTGKLKLSETQADLLLRANGPGTEEGLYIGTDNGQRIRGRGQDATAYALQRRGLAQYFATACRVLLTGEGRRLAALLAQERG